MKERWTRILDELAEKHPADFRHMLRLALEGVRDGKIILSGTPTAVEAWEDRHRRQRLAETASAVLGGEAEFEFDVKASRRLAARKAAAAVGETLESLARHPSVDRVRSLFDGVVVRCEAAAAPVPAEAREDGEDGEE